VGRYFAHYIALTRPAKITTNFQPYFNYENGNLIFFTITAAKVGVFLRSINAARNSKSSNVRNRPCMSPFPQYFIDCVLLENFSAAPRLRPLFRDKQIVEGSDGCGLFVDNFLLKIVLFCVFYRVSIGLHCFKLRIMNPDLSELRLLSFLFQYVKVATTIIFPPKKGHKGFHIFTKLLFFL
jgi:hypothetical protein